MAKLTKEQWIAARQCWEADNRQGFQWLSEKLAKDGAPIDRSALARKAQRDGWVKNVTPECHAEPENVTQMSRKNVTQPEQRDISKQDKANQEKPEKEEASRENPKKNETKIESQEIEVAQNVQKLHGNTKYMPNYDREVYELCLLGYTDKEIALHFDVSEQTVNNWKNWYPNFFESMRAGKARANARVAEALYRRAIGYITTETRVKTIPNPDGDHLPGIVIEQIEITKEVLPDVGACLKFLSAREPELWRENNGTQNEEENLPEITKELIERERRIEAAREKNRSILRQRGILIDQAEEGEIVVKGE